MIEKQARIKKSYQMQVEGRIKVLKQ